MSLNLLPIVENYFKTRKLTQHHLDSFNTFIEQGLKDILKANSTITSESDPDWFVKYLDIRVGKPEVRDGQNRHSLTPQECRLRDLTYSAPIYVDIEYKRGTDVLSQKNLLIGRMPIMLRSNNCILFMKTEQELMKLQECPNDPGGYFIVKGTEKVILMQEQASKNRIFTFRNDKEIVSEVTCISAERKSRLMLSMNKKGQVMVKHNVFPKEGIPVVVLFKAMMGLSDRVICGMVMHNIAEEHKREFFKLFLPSIEHHVELDVNSEASALRFIGSKITLTRDSNKHQMALAYEVLYNSILTHIPVVKDSFYPKTIFLAFMVRRLIMAHIDPDKHLDNRDFFGNKRVELAGTLISYVFEDAFKRYNSMLMATANKSIPKVKVCQFDVTKHMTSNLITHSLNNAISTGNWNIRRFRISRVGVSQVLSRLSHLATLGALTRINSTFEKTRKTTGPRSLQASHWGIICPSDTPEGESCGLVKNMALMCQVTTEDDDKIIYELACHSKYMIHYGNTDFDRESFNVHFLFVNGAIIGYITQPKPFMAYMREQRRSGIISRYTSIYSISAHRAIYIVSDAGRLARPYVIVDPDGSIRLTQQHIGLVRRGIFNFVDLIHMGALECLDTNELNDCHIALSEKDIVPGKTTHMEVETFCLLGVCASIVPFPHHNQSPRNTYQCAMGKQAMGVIGLNQNFRNDSLLYTIQYPQYPMTRTKPMEMFKWMPAGQNPVVAVMSYSAYDLEDATVLNKSSIELGYARCFVYKNIKSELGTYANRNCRDRLVQPNNDDPRKAGRYDSLESDGIASPESYIHDGQVLINRETPNVQHSQNLVSSEAIKYHDTSVIYRTQKDSVIDKVTISNNDDNVVIKILYRQMRVPIVGDKFSSRHGQKGVVGAIFNKALLPFTCDGISPDTIMNPHGFPSRMTVGKLKEMTAAKAGAFKGKWQDATVFGGVPMDECYDIMHRHHRLHSGKELVVSGITGELMPNEVYIGPIYYQRLKHMVVDKMHSRNIGPTTALTRQPTEGRSRDGGLRVGEMERDCLIGHGTAFSLLERFMFSSDAYEVDVCNHCNFLVAGKFCMKCNCSENIIKVRIPYAFKLLTQELFSMGVQPAIGFKLDKKL